MALPHIAARSSRRCCAAVAGRDQAIP